MKISNLIPTYLLPFSLFCQVLGAPTNGKRGDVVVVKVKTTVQQTQTDIHTISEATGTTTNYLINTSTETFTRYTATVTSTVYGVPHTYTTVANTPVSAADVVPNSENEVKSSPTENPVEQETTTSSSSVAATTTTPVAKIPVSSQQTSTPTPVPAETTSTSSASSSSSSSKQTTTLAEASETAINDTTETSGPTITGSVSSQTTDSWIIENISTVTSDGTCYVNYDYYYATETDDAEETTTLTSTITTTVTLN
ncbi:conserved hypothetical protein [Candida dubliniensis CD36]|uniref:Uncharacterized protein n=1 Tax=Candida dubliniensis (strain CD36 / ATCC MYA-646 / CBS 7987 / NCPF 3949 / NRRL Y-17841) TaxID=573826 RepID=B9W953_CANDC|nr:conserved hypothetical protein [Candida dubliniensis CD36]CAX45294.1 conserved hypothetical protein [Candida dubliniensis CD36]